MGGRAGLLRLVHLTHDADELACDREVLVLLDNDRAVTRVSRTQFDMVCGGVIILDGCFVVDLGHDDFASVSRLLLASENQVAIENAGVDHGVALDAERKDIGTASEEVAVDGDGAFEVLHCKNRRTGSDAAHDRNFNGIGRSFR